LIHRRRWPAWLLVDRTTVDRACAATPAAACCATSAVTAVTAITCRARSLAAA